VRVWFPGYVKTAAQPQQHASELTLNWGHIVPEAVLYAQVTEASEERRT